MPVRRGWDFGMQFVLEQLHQDEQFRATVHEAWAAAEDDPDEGDFRNCIYCKSIDELTNNCWSKRVSGESVGLYIVGVFLRHP